MISPHEPRAFAERCAGRTARNPFRATIARVFEDQETLLAIPGGFGGGDDNVAVARVSVKESVLEDEREVGI
jgi:hypothetical protein